MTVSRDLVNYKKWLWYKTHAKNGKSMIEAIDVKVRDFRAV